MSNLIFNSIKGDDKDRVIVNVSGRLDSISCNEFEDFVMPLVTPEVINITLDLKHLEYISSSGLRVFILLSKAVHSNNGNVIIQNCSSFIYSIIEISGLLPFFNVE